MHAQSKIHRTTNLRKPPPISAAAPKHVWTHFIFKPKTTLQLHPWPEPFVYVQAAVDQAGVPASSFVKQTHPIVLEPTPAEASKRQLRLSLHICIQTNGHRNCCAATTCTTPLDLTPPKWCTAAASSVCETDAPHCVGTSQQEPASTDTAHSHPRLYLP
jgi:hypothetical protein